MDYDFSSLYLKIIKNYFNNPNEKMRVVLNGKTVLYYNTHPYKVNISYYIPGKSTPTSLYQLYFYK